ncbi:aldehyde dehydrogenase family protein [Lentzea sp. NPDC059081]|uniref:aldehyde dehydrogenase family protein n=1 Tax=Lentzea sp. NPDC059081 TaxID=3346719 RepID=UPI003695D3F2
MTAKTHHLGHWIDGRTTVAVADTIDVVDPTSGLTVATVSAGTDADVDDAVLAARRAFPAWAATSPEHRAKIMERLADELDTSAEAITSTIVAELGSPVSATRAGQVAAPIALARVFAEVGRTFPWTEEVGHSLVVREPLGVVGAITPWNFPLNQMMVKIGAGLIAGNTMVVKPPEAAPSTANILAEAAQRAGVPDGVLNIVHGTGAEAGQAVAAHPDVDMVTFTGSTATGALVAASAAGTVKRVSLELGGKSASIILDDADLAAAAEATLSSAWFNSGQVCAAWTRLLVPRHLHDEVVDVLVAAAEQFRVGDPRDETTVLGPLVSETQRQRVDTYIRRGVDDGARLVYGGAGRPEGLQHGAFVRPTIFADVDPDSVIAQEEIFGPVLTVIAYRSEADAVAIANNSPYGLHGAVFGDPERALAVARLLRTGQVDVNGAPFNPNAPFGGYKKSGYGREFGRYGVDEQLETKSIQQ